MAVHGMVDPFLHCLHDRVGRFLYCVLHNLSLALGKMAQHIVGQIHPGRLFPHAHPDSGELLGPQMGDDVLEKKCKPVTKMTLRTKILIEDMLDTMYEKMGVGLAAPQVGILKQIVVIDVGEGPIVLINPEIVETSGEQTGEEGCLSVPGKWGIVTRPNYVKVRALNENMEEFEIEGEELLARAFCHEIDHLGGHLYVEKVEGELHDSPAYNEEDMEYEVEE